MGQSQGKESRPFDSSDGAAGSRDRRLAAGEGSGAAGDATSRTNRARMSRTDLSFLGIGSSSGNRVNNRSDGTERRETRQEREARRQEKERLARAKERERSLQEEHVDGGYLVTLGTYVGPEDFSKTVVRHLQIERKLAPFWRGLNDWSESWAEHQLIAAARGLDIPAADDPPDPELVPRPPPPVSTSSSNLQNLTVPMGPRTMSAASDRSGSNLGSGLPSPTTASHGRSSPFKPRAKALAAALSVGSRNASSTDLTPKEIQLPHDPFVNGQPLEVFLYKDASECPICFLTYPPYLNHTRCCDQPICSECFVQIKRAEPHLPEHHPDGGARDPSAPLQPEDPPEMLISEPTACPYCQQPEFGVTYEPPPFRRGLAFSTMSNFHSTAMSSQSSLNSTVPPTSPSQPNRRRAHSLSANAPNVITTDRVRPDWASKLAAARAHQARRAAAATALHTAAFLIGNNESRSILRPGRFSRRNTGQNSAAGSDSRQPGASTDGTEMGEATPAGNSRRRNRMAELEEMMLAEAVRLSIAAEADRQRKEEKALRKEAKKKLKEERKALKKQGSDPYSGGTSGASGSSLSLGLGRRRGNSAASNLRMEVTVQGASSAVKGTETPPDAGGGRGDAGDHKGKGVDRGTGEELGEPTSSATSLPIPVASSRGGSHLRQMSNASSIGSSLADSPSGSYTGQGFSGPEGTSSQTAGNEADAGTESLFNFRSLAEMVGVNLEDGSATRVEGDEQETSHGRPLSRVNEEDDKEVMESEHVEEATTIHGLKAPTATKSGTNLPTPELMITPETPAPDDELTGHQKQLGHSSFAERPAQVAP
ncbi:hypothetical protein NLU13_3771 [Sarocladium strictum]|uniref:Uncharacterized protein n=1 Tax=Sarocladium strictum TaxID=5046 RepID=A0AA39GHN8_SARSR|nr:hypothetical protein NLU13_3771 [Sarocladium strictum]